MTSASRAAYALSITLSAFLLFQVQPLIAKLILPWFGGAAGVWSVCLLFFQAILLLGYAYAHAVSQRYQRRHQSLIHLAILVASLFVLPIVPPSSLMVSGHGSPIINILIVLGAAVGLPYLVLSSTSPLLQAWYSRSANDSDPYRLYSLSNIGSLLALLSYPFLVEPFIPSHHQAIDWSVAYGCLVVLLVAIAFLSKENTQADQPVRQTAVPHASWIIKTLWVSLAACGSALLLSITNYISQDIAAVPLIWLVPLSLYLLTFILCFESDRWYRRHLFLILFAVSLAAMAYTLVSSYGSIHPIFLIGVFCGGLFVCCMVCHGELVHLKPPHSQLTSFYMSISLGGTLGALFVAVLAPCIFSGFYELPISLGFCGILIHAVLRREGSAWTPSQLLNRRTTVLLVCLLVALWVRFHLIARQSATTVLMKARNFYGVVEVEDHLSSGATGPDTETHRPMEASYRELVNGTIEHGVQFLTPSLRREATTYYGPKSGIALALRGEERSGLIKVGIVGLGAGTLATYGRHGDQYIFYEINPLVAKVAEKEFSFIRDSDASVRTVIGDGRLSLEREAPQGFDVLAIDAFSGDAIPTHLLTREAFELYVRQLAANGIIAIHATNKYLNLVPVVAAGAVSVHLKALVVYSEADYSHAVLPATWILVGSESTLSTRIGTIPTGDLADVSSEKQDLWTDDYSSVVKVFR